MTRPDVVDAKVYKLKSAFVKKSVFITLSYTEENGQKRPIEIFINSKDLSRSHEYVMLTRLISAVFRRDADVMFILEELQGILDPEGGRFKEGNYYQFTVKDDNGCQKSDTVFVFASFQANTYLGSAPLNVEFQNTSSEGLYSWDFGDEGTSIEPNPFHDFTEIGGYEVVLTITDEQNECQSTFSDSIHVQGFEVEGELMDWAEMYNAFSPDGDGTNDEFTFLENHAIKDFKVIVYNRWGNKIYQWSDPKKGWDGKDESGNPVKNGVYFYLMNATGENGKEYEHKGSLSLYR